jgi:hypothetical protein
VKGQQLYLSACIDLYNGEIISRHRYSAPPAERQKADDQQAEMKRLKAELKRVTEEPAIS